MTTVVDSGQTGVRIQVWMGGASAGPPGGGPQIDVTDLPARLPEAGDTAPYSWGSAVGFQDFQILPLQPQQQTTYTYSTADRLGGVTTASGSCTEATGCISYDYRGNTTKLSGSEYRFDSANRMVRSKSLPEPADPRIHPLAVSPDRRRVVFSSMRDGPSEIYTAATDGSDLRRLTFSDALGPGVTNTNPRYSPHGGRIVFTSNRDGDVELYTMAADGSDLQRLTHSPGVDDHASYSPDGTQIVFVSERDGQRDLYKMSASGGAPTRLTNDQDGESYPVFSPDGTQIVFGWAYGAPEPPFATNSQIVKISADGTQRQQLTNTAGFSWLPQFSPDQTAIAFASSRAGEKQDVYTVSSDGTKRDASPPTQRTTRPPPGSTTRPYSSPPTETAPDRV